MNKVQHTYSKWRHGGWYVTNIRYRNGAVCCVSNNYPDKKWRVVDGPHSETFKTRDAAASNELNRVKGIT